MIAGTQVSGSSSGTDDKGQAAAFLGRTGTGSKSQTLSFTRRESTCRGHRGWRSRLLVSKAGERALLLLKLATLREERDAWEGRSQRNFDLACSLVAAVEKRIRILDAESATPVPPNKTRSCERSTAD